MANQLQYGEILEGAEGLSVEDQETLVETLKNRLRERRRAELARGVQATQSEFTQGRCQPSTPAEPGYEIRGPRGKA